MISANRRNLPVLVLFSCMAFAQQSNRTSFTVGQAVNQAGQFPSVVAAQEQVNAAAAGIRVARTNYLPSVNAIGQVNRATRNNVFGLLLPQSVISSMSGPVLGVMTEPRCGGALPAFLYPGSLLTSAEGALWFGPRKPPRTGPTFQPNELDSKFRRALLPRS